jgi:hypothetical protein
LSIKYLRRFRRHEEKMCLPSACHFSGERSAELRPLNVCRICSDAPKPQADDTSEMLDDALSEIDVQDAEHFVGELGPTFPVVRSTSESTPQTERQCAEKLTF